MASGLLGLHGVLAVKAVGKMAPVPGNAPARIRLQGPREWTVQEVTHIYKNVSMDYVQVK